MVIEYEKPRYLQEAVPIILLFGALPILLTGAHRFYVQPQEMEASML